MSLLIWRRDGERMHIDVPSAGLRFFRMSTKLEPAIISADAARPRVLDNLGEFVPRNNGIADNLGFDKSALRAFKQPLLTKIRAGGNNGQIHRASAYGAIRSLNRPKQNICQR
jgi:hypothetical protein